MEFLIPVTAILMPLGIVTVVSRAKHRARVRENDHRERMRALELGISPYGRPAAAMGWPGLLAVGMGAVMPAAVFMFAWMASMTSHSGEEAWVGATLVGGAGVLGGLRMGTRLLAARHANPSEPDPASLASRSFANGHARKPAFNPDAYDAIAQRG